MEKKRVMITGASGMVGGLVLDDCLSREDVEQVISLVRRSSDRQHPKLQEIEVADFLDYRNLEQQFAGIDCCFFCIGIYTGQVSEEEFSRITVDYTKAFAAMLQRMSPSCVFVFLSGAGADPSGKSRMLFARKKGEAENYLRSLGFSRLHIFRPGYIYPVTKRKEPNWIYALTRVLYRLIFSWLYPSIGITSVQLAQAMTDAAFDGCSLTVLENTDIRSRIRK